MISGARRRDDGNAAWVRGQQAITLASRITFAMHWPLATSHPATERLHSMPVCAEDRAKLAPAIMRTAACHSGSCLHNAKLPSQRGTA